jgi:GH24 family phage-related lysozyme (muramidase)
MLTAPQIQIALNKAGYGPLKVDGVIGPRTLAAIRRFQSLSKLMPDGVVGPRTDAKLGAFYALVSPSVVKPPVATEDGMQFSPRGLQMLDNSEDIRTAAYRDTKGIVTIGLGMTWGSEIFREWWEKNRPGKEFDMSARMTKAEIMPLVHRMLNEEYAKAVNDALGGVKVAQHAFDAAVHFVWNAGVGSVKWKWFAPFKAGNYAASASLLRTNYNKPPELFSRRQKEADLMEHGVYH